MFPILRDFQLLCLKSEICINLLYLKLIIFRRNVRNLIFLPLLRLDASHLLRGQRLEIRRVLAVSLQSKRLRIQESCDMKVCLFIENNIHPRVAKCDRVNNDIPVCRQGTAHSPLFEVCSNRSDISVVKT